MTQDKLVKASFLEEIKRWVVISKSKCGLNNNTSTVLILPDLYQFFAMRSFANLIRCNPMEGKDVSGKIQSFGV